MRLWSLLFALFFTGWVWGQSLELPEEIRVGDNLALAITDLTDQPYRIDVYGPSQREFALSETRPEQARIEVLFSPREQGIYTLRLRSLGEEASDVLRQEFTVFPKLLNPEIEADGIHLGNFVLPLTLPWLDPALVHTRAYVASGPLLLELDREEPQLLAAYFPPAEVRSLVGGPELTIILTDGRRLSLADLNAPLPYEGSWSSLATLRQYLELKAQNPELAPAEPAHLPYWLALARPAAQLDSADYQAIGQDLLRRGHKVELAWGQEAYQGWLESWVAQARAGDLAASEALLRYAPLFPGSRQFFAEQADALAAGGDLVQAERYRKASADLAYFLPVLNSHQALAALYGVLTVYLALWVLLLARYYGLRNRDLAAFGGAFRAWLRAPGVRLAHPLVRYASIWERGLLVVVLALLLATGIFYGLVQKAESDWNRAEFGRASLQTSAAQEALSQYPATPGLRALQGYSLLAQDPQQARQLLGGVPGYPYVLTALAQGGEEPGLLISARQLDPSYAPALEALGLGGDFWTDSYLEAGASRGPVPSQRALAETLLIFQGQSWLQDPWSQATQSWPLAGWNSALQYLVAALLALVALYHVVGLFWFRPQGARQRGRLAWTLAFLIPGSTSIPVGWGLLLIGAFAYGVVGWVFGAPWALWVLAASYLVHWIFAGLLLRQSRREAHGLP